MVSPPPAWTALGLSHYVAFISNDCILIVDFAFKAQGAPAECTSAGCLAPEHLPGSVGDGHVSPSTGLHFAQDTAFRAVVQPCRIVTSHLEFFQWHQSGDAKRVLPYLLK